MQGSVPLCDARFVTSSALPFNLLHIDDLDLGVFNPLPAFLAPHCSMLAGFPAVGGAPRSVGPRAAAERGRG